MAVITASAIIEPQYLAGCSGVSIRTPSLTGGYCTGSHSASRSPASAVIYHSKS